MRTILALTALAASTAAATSVSCTPHDSYSSSVGVLGCKINTNRVAYWPGAVDCTNICVKLTYGSRSVYLLRVDQSGGAHDISYDAWNYLQTGASATADPISGGGVAMEYEDVDASACAGLLYTPGAKLPLSASNSMDFVAGCLADSGSWVAQNHVLYNIADPLCALGFDEPCTLDLATSNQPSCAHTLGLTTPLTTAPVYNIEYPTGKCVDSTTGAEVAASVALAAGGGGEESAGGDAGSADTTTETPTTAVAAAAAPTTTSTTPTTPTTSTTSTTPPPPPPTTTTTAAAAADTSVSPGIFVTTGAAAAPAAPSTPAQPTTLTTSTTAAVPTSTSASTSTTLTASTTSSSSTSASSSASATTTPTTLSRVVASSCTSTPSSTKTSASSSARLLTAAASTAASSKTTSSSSSSSATSTASKATAAPTAASGAAALAKPASLCAVAGAWAVGWLLF